MTSMAVRRRACAHARGLSARPRARATTRGAARPPAQRARLYAAVPLHLQTFNTRPLSMDPKRLGFALTHGLRVTSCCLSPLCCSDLALRDGCCCCSRPSTLPAFIGAGLTLWPKASGRPSAPPSGLAGSSATRARRPAAPTRPARPAARPTAAGPPPGARRPLRRRRPPPPPKVPHLCQPEAAAAAAPLVRSRMSAA